MALLITAECINCGACLPECPNEAIFEKRSDAEEKETMWATARARETIFTSLRMTGAQSVSDILTSLNVQRFARSIIVASLIQPIRRRPRFCWRKQRSSILTRPSTRQKFGAVYGTNRFLFEGPRNIFTRLPKGLIR